MLFGEFLIASAITSLIGGAIQYQASSNAASRAEEETRRALERQSQYQRQAEAAAMEQAKEFGTEDRAEKQKELETEMTEEFYQPVEAAQTANALSSTSKGNVSEDYLKAKSASNTNQLKMAKQLAGLLGKQASANKLRQNEAIDMSNTASNIGRIGSFANGMYNADQMAIKHASQPDPGMNVFAGVVKDIGKSYISGLG